MEKQTPPIHQPRNKKEKFNDEEKISLAEQILLKFGNMDNQPSKNSYKAFTIITAIFIVVLIFTTIFFVGTLNKMNAAYTQKTEQVILGKEDVEMANSWERLPIQQRKEQMRLQYFKIIQYYTINLPEEQKMNNDLLLDSFNSLWIATQRLNQNIFISLAYMKVATNFNPIYDKDSRKGIGAFYLKMYEQVSDMQLVRDDPTFQVIYKGSDTINNPTLAIKLIVAKINDLMATFNSRIDWVFFALFTNEYDVIEKYWNNGNGSIPDEYYKSGKLANALMYYHAFTNWEIPKI